MPRRVQLDWLRSRASALWPRARRWLIVIAALVLVGPFALILPLNFVQPGATAVMLRRATQRWRSGKQPAYPVRVVLTRGAISPNLRRAVLAAEDDRFYLHWGFDLVEVQSAIDRARSGRRLRGASTITQQVAKNIFLWEGRSFIRKGYEAYLTLVLELCLPKDRILDLYLNLAEWGDGIFGAEAAAQRHFRKPARDLSLEEAARLAAILPSPVKWPPQGRVADSRLPDILTRMSYPALREIPRPRSARRR